MVKEGRVVELNFMSGVRRGGTFIQEYDGFEARLASALPLKCNKDEVIQALGEPQRTPER